MMMMSFRSVEVDFVAESGFRLTDIGIRKILMDFVAFVNFDFQTRFKPSKPHNLMPMYVCVCLRLMLLCSWLTCPQHSVVSITYAGTLAYAQCAIHSTITTYGSRAVTVSHRTLRTLCQC